VTPTRPDMTDTDRRSVSGAQPDEGRDAAATQGANSGVVERARAWVEGTRRALLARPWVRLVVSVNEEYNAAGGGLVASGLAYSALFALIPGLLLVVSVLIVLIDDATTRQTAIDWLVGQVPPLHDVAATIVGTVASDARVGSLLGLILFLWGASGFYLALDSAIDRTIPGGHPENPVLARVRGVAAVGIVVIAALIAFSLSVLGSVVSLGPLLPIASPVLAVAVSSLLCLTVYLVLPNERPTVRDAAPAALAAGTGIGLLTTGFGVLAPLLVQGFMALGVIASVFVALVWFNWTFQIMLMGASYARLRRDGFGAAAGPVDATKGNALSNE
jgi:membrane protein